MDTGITTVAVLQSLARARDCWGHEQAQAIWDLATLKVILGGSSNAGDLRHVTESTRQRSVLESSIILRLRVGHGLLLLRSASPIVLTLQP